MTQTARILKVDMAGRVWTPREQRDAVLDEFERSGLPATKFAAHIGVKYPTFASWVQKRRKRRGNGAAPSRKRASKKWLEISTCTIYDNYRQGLGCTPKNRIRAVSPIKNGR